MIAYCDRLPHLTGMISTLGNPPIYVVIGRTQSSSISFPTHSAREAMARAKQLGGDGYAVEVLENGNGAISLKRLTARAKSEPLQ